VLHVAYEVKHCKLFVASSSWLWMKNIEFAYLLYFLPCVATGVVQEADFEVSAAREMRREQKNIKAKRKES